jgi:hypothetical protein
MSLEHAPECTKLRGLAQLPTYENDDEVLTFAEWCKLNKISARTGRRILAGPKSKRPIITWLSERRMGVTRGNNRRWQESRAR